MSFQSLPVKNSASSTMPLPVLPSFLTSTTISKPYINRSYFYLEIAMFILFIKHMVSWSVLKLKQNKAAERSRKHYTWISSQWYKVRKIWGKREEGIKYPPTHGCSTSDWNRKRDWGKSIWNRKQVMKENQRNEKKECWG